MTLVKRGESGRRSTAEALRESEERFRILADNIAQLAWMADAEGCIHWYNHRWFNYTGKGPEDMARQGWAPVVHPDHRQRVCSKFNECIARGEAWEDTFPLRRHDGQFRWFLSRALPTRDNSGKVLRWLGTNTDVSEQRQVEQLLRESDRRKDEYLAMLGHELRNPLAGISAAVELAKMTPLDDPRLSQAVDVLERQSTHITRIVDSLLEVSRIERGKIEVRHRPLNLCALLEALVKDRAAQFEERGLRFEAVLPEQDLWVAGDWDRLLQVFDNLLSNAMRFTYGAGTVSLSLEYSESQLLVRVSDSGRGIRREALNRIFEPFWQEGPDVSRASGGLGLGLALARSLVGMHGGQVEARSEGLGRGAEFRVSLPRVEAPASQEPANSLGSAGRRHLQILVVEDNADAANTLGSLLEIKGHSVEVVRSGLDALNALGQHGADLVLCDIGLPGISGYEFARRVRAEGIRRIPHLVALTGYGQPSDRDRSLKAGFDEHLTKPVALGDLDGILAAAS